LKINDVLFSGIAFLGGLSQGKRTPWGSLIIKLSYV
jgi:hypothetical protein